MWLITAAGLVALFAAASLWLARYRKLEWKSWLGAAVLVAWVVGAVVKVHFDRSSAAAATAAAIAWPATTSAARAAKPAAQAAAAGRQDGSPVGSVESMIGGLEKRLEQQPDDADGWALLAQSYAFIGDAAGVDKALAKAIALGVDEQTLRARIDQAKRGPHDAAAGSGG